MNPRRFFFLSTGDLRAPWRIAAFLVVAYVFNMLTARVVLWAWPAHDTIAVMIRGFTGLLLALLAAHAFMLRVVESCPWSSVGLGVQQATPRVLGIGFAIGALGILVPSGALLLAHWLRPAPATLAAGASGAFALQLTALFLPQSLAEELLSRGYVFAAIRDGAGDWWAIGSTSLVFAALHGANPGASAQSFILVALAGVLLSLVLVVTGSLWAAWMTHFAWNFSIAGVLHAPLSGFAFRAPGYTVVDAGPAWVTGGAWGPEGGAAAALGMSAGIALLIAWRRRAARTLPPAPAHG